MFGFLMGTLQKFKEKEEAVKGLEKVRQMLCIRNLSAVINSIIAHGLHLSVTLSSSCFSLPSHSR